MVTGEEINFPLGKWPQKLRQSYKGMVNIQDVQVQPSKTSVLHFLDVPALTQLICISELHL